MTFAIVDHMQGDLNLSWLSRALAASRVALDTETTGLDWRTSELRTVQLEVDGEIAILAVKNEVPPKNLLELISYDGVTKVFHHAAFDLRFMVSAWGAAPRNIACTKIAAKVVLPGLPPTSYSLAPLLKSRLGISIDKTQQMSDWSQPLSPEQVEYAANDVMHLGSLLDSLWAEARATGVVDLVAASFRYLPTRVQLDLIGSGDVFTH